MRGKNEKPNIHRSGKAEAATRKPVPVNKGTAAFRLADTNTRLRVTARGRVSTRIYAPTTRRFDDTTPDVERSGKLAGRYRGEKLDRRRRPRGPRRRRSRTPVRHSRVSTVELTRNNISPALLTDAAFSCRRRATSFIKLNNGCLPRSLRAISPHRAFHGKSLFPRSESPLNLSFSPLFYLHPRVRVRKRERFQRASRRKRFIAAHPLLSSRNRLSPRIIKTAVCVGDFLRVLESPAPLRGLVAS